MSTPIINRYSKIPRAKGNEGYLILVDEQELEVFERELRAKREHYNRLTPILEEMKRQSEKWGEQNHHPFIYQNILVEEVGEVSQAILKTEFESGKDWKNVEEELIQVAAVAVSMLESLRRNQL